MLEITQEKIETAIANNFDKVFNDFMGNSWSSPIHKILEEKEFSEKLQEIVRETLYGLLENPDFKEKLQQRMIETAISKFLKG